MVIWNGKELAMVQLTVPLLSTFVAYSTNYGHKRATHYGLVRVLSCYLRVLDTPDGAYCLPRTQDINVYKTQWKA